MFCSTIIPTIGRSTLARAVNSVLDQQVDQTFEIIVVNDSGSPLPDEVWQHDPRVRILATDRQERSVARNTGAAAAHGTYLHFLDDDDWLLPGGLQALVKVAVDHPEAVLLYGQTQFVDRMGQATMLLKHDLAGRRGFIVVMSGETIPLQSALVRKAAFDAVKGFQSWMAGPENHDLVRRILARGDLHEIDYVISCVERGESGSSTDVARIRPQSRKGREIVLNEPGVYARMLESAGGDSYWTGRVLYIYITSSLYNLGKLHFPRAFMRMIIAGRTGLHAFPHWFSAAFWAALFRPFRSQAYARAQAAAQGNQ